MPSIRTTGNNPGRKLFESLKEKAESVRGRTVSTETASKAVMSMLDLVVDVAGRIRDQVPPEMIGAVDLTAEMSLVAFSVGVQVDLEKIPGRQNKGSNEKRDTSPEPKEG